MPNTNITYSSKNSYIDERGFLYFKVITQENANLLTIGKLNRYIITVSKICENNYLPFLVDLRDVSGTVKNNTLKLLAKDIHLKSVCSKMAFIVNSLPIKILIINYIKMHKPKILSIVFDDIDEGINFCKTP